MHAFLGIHDHHMRQNIGKLFVIKYSNNLDLEDTRPIIDIQLRNTHESIIGFHVTHYSGTLSYSC